MMRNIYRYRIITFLFLAVMLIFAESISSKITLVVKAQDLSDAFIGSVNNVAVNSRYTYVNPFWQKDTSKGVEISFKINRQDSNYILGAVWSIMTEDGVQYFTPGSYLGYNGAGGWYDANLTPDYGFVKGYIKTGDDVTIRLLPEGFQLYVNDVLCYDQTIIYESSRGRFVNITEEADGLYKKSLETISKEGYLQFGFGSWWNVYGWDEAKLDISDAVFKLGDGTIVGNYFMENGESEEIYHSKEAVPITGISLDTKTIFLNAKGATAYVSANIMPSDASNKEVMWGSNAEEIVSIDNNGKITALKNGTAYINAISRDGGYRASGITVIVTGCEELTLKKTKFNLTVGKKGKIKASAEKSVSYKSLNKKIADVSSKGVIKAKNAGKAVILVKSGNTQKRVRVTVNYAGNVITIQKGMKLSKVKVSIKKGNKLAIQKTSDISGKVTYKSSNKKIASVSVKGIVKAKKRGKTVILIKHGAKTVKLKITVKR